VTIRRIRQNRRKSAFPSVGACSGGDSQARENPRRT